MRTAHIDLRSTFARPLVDALTESAMKPVRKINHAAYKAPALGSTKTSQLRENTERNAAPEVQRAHNAERLAAMPASQLRKHAKEMGIPLAALRKLVADHKEGVEQPPEDAAEALHRSYLIAAVQQQADAQRKAAERFGNPGQRRRELIAAREDAAAAQLATRLGALQCAAISTAR
ncbi:MAG: hypothetical protein JO067_11070 [Cupriavidus sp.]|nr:hypothetical protein [Cupriavidus sp.]